jgi:hypothetical protein
MFHPVMRINRATGTAYGVGTLSAENSGARPRERPRAATKMPMGQLSVDEGQERNRDAHVAGVGKACRQRVTTLQRPRVASSGRHRERYNEHRHQREQRCGNHPERDVSRQIGRQQAVEHQRRAQEIHDDGADRACVERSPSLKARADSGDDERGEDDREKDIEHGTW